MTDDPIILFDCLVRRGHGVASPTIPKRWRWPPPTAHGRPSVRMVLLKGHDDRGFVFYTNLDSRKGGELAANPDASLLFHWKSLRRQVRIEGPVEPVSDAEADAYFASRGRNSRLGAWASDQSRPLADRATFEARFEQMRAKFEGGDVPRPPRWSGFRVIPARSNSGRTAPTASTSAACSPAPATDAGPKACSTHERSAHPDPRRAARHAYHPRRAGQHRDGDLPRRAQKLCRDRTPARSRCSAAWPTPRSTCSPASSPSSACASRPMPADDDHRFGHGKAEALAALAQVVLIAISAIAIALARGRPAGRQCAHRRGWSLASACRWWRSPRPSPCSPTSATSSSAPDRSRSRPTMSITSRTCCSTCR